jgi:hypothetical protein
MNGTCITAGGGGGVSLSAANTWTALQTFQSGLLSQASSTFTGALTLSGGIVNYGANSTSTVPNNAAYAWTIATSSTAQPLFAIDTTSGSESVSLGAAGADVYIGDAGSSPDLVFENSGTIKTASGGTLTIGDGSDIVNFGVNVGIGSTTPGSLLSVGSANGINFTTATSTFSSTGGINITSGCFAVNGACITGGGGGSSASSTLLADFNTFTNLQRLNGGLLSLASSTIGNGTAGLTISGNSTTTGNSLVSGGLNVGTVPVAPVTGGIYLQRATNPFISFYYGSTQAGQLRANSTSQLSLTDPTGNSPYLSINTGGSAAGNVGVGTTSPFANFAVQKNYGSTNTTLFAVSSSTNSGGTTATTLFSVDSSGVATVGNESGAGDANFQFASDANAWSVGYKSSDKSFNIASSTNFSGTAALSIAKNGNATFTGSGGTCTINGSGACTSDIRLKTDVATTTGQDALAKLAKLDAITYTWSDPKLDQAQRLGVVAQQVQEVFPQLVGSTTVNFMGTTGTYLTVDYGGLAAPLIAAVNELNLRTGFLATTTATSTPDELADGPFKAASDWLKSALASGLDAIQGVADIGVRNVGAAIYAAAGAFNEVFAQTITADTVKAKQLCLEDVCITKTELQNLLNQQHSSGGGSGGNGGGGGSVPPPAPEPAGPEPEPQASSTPETAPEPEAPAPEETAPEPEAPAPELEDTPAPEATPEPEPAPEDSAPQDAPAPAPASAPAAGGEGGAVQP